MQFAVTVPAVADKLLQIGVSKILEAIDEADFLDGSYGYRPGRGALDAVFALRVRGDSMTEDQIEDGDLILVKRQATATNGEVVVALIDGEAAPP